MDVWAVQGQDNNSGPPYDGLYIGLDLGTSNSCIALWNIHKNRVKIIRVDADHRSMPSVVYYPQDPNSPPLVGHSALQESLASGRRVVSCAKRIIGLKFSDPELKSMLSELPVDVIEDPQSGLAVIRSPGAPDDRTISPVEVSALVIRELKALAEGWVAKGKVKGLQAPLEGCVITAPVHFGEARKAAIREAARQAGFKHIVTLGESTAAAMAYGLFVAGSKTVLVFDFGGGTLDVSALAVDEGRFDVLSTAGDNHLGGEDMDQRLLAWVLSSAGICGADRQKLQADFPDALAALRVACCQAKVELSSEPQARVRYRHAPSELTVDAVITREAFEGLVQDLLDRAEEVVRRALEGAELGADEVGEVVLVGGCSRVPAVRAMLQRVCPGKELCTSINPDEAVAEGAAIRGAVLSGIDRGVLQDVLMVDALPMSIGVETADGAFEVVLPRNAALPATATHTFQLAEEGQPGITVDVYEGESDVAKENKWVTRFTFLLTKLPEEQEDHPYAAMRGTSAQGAKAARSVNVVFTMTGEGMLKVRVQDDAAQRGGPMGPQAYMLALYCAALLFVYVFARVYFAGTRPGDPSSVASASV